MTSTSDKYVEAARNDVEKLQKEFDDVQQRFTGSSSKLDSELVETAWNDFQEQWRKLSAAGETASTELRNSYEEARQRFQKVLDSYRNN